MDSPHPWERRPGENDRAWFAFTVFRDLGARRSIDGARKAAGPKAGTWRKWDAWAQAHDWKARVRAWDAEVDRRKREAQLQAHEDMARRHVEQAMALQSVARGALGRWLDPTNEEKPKLNVWAVMRLIELGAHLERTARGEAPSQGEAQEGLTWADLMLLAEQEGEQA